MNPVEKYRCPFCGHEEDVGGRLDDGPIRIRSNCLGVSAVFANSRVKALTEAELRHVCPRRHERGAKR